jgi:DNA-binding response OmpR family regulator
VTHLILVLDDEPELLGMVKDVLMRSGYQVLVTDHPERALVLSREQHPDLMLMDGRCRVSYSWTSRASRRTRVINGVRAVSFPLAASRAEVT